MSPRVPTADEVLRYFQECSNWGRWGPSDQLGAINFITTEKRKRAAALVREGVTVGCSRLLAPETAPDAFVPMTHKVTRSGERWSGKKSGSEVQSGGDYIGLPIHSLTMTHIDSPAHIFRDGLMYNGHPAAAVTEAEGATKESVELIRDGVVTRGVLIDAPMVRGSDRWLPRTTQLFPEDLEEAERKCNVRVESGDVLLVRTGWTRFRQEHGPLDPKEGRPGLHPACIPWLYKREVAVLAGDASNDAAPHGVDGSDYPGLGVPIHQVGISAMGMWIVDNVDLERLAETCRRYQRWEFLLTIAPLYIQYGTGSPVNPIAMF